jgi:hypothetical protein
LTGLVSDAILQEGVSTLGDYRNPYVTVMAVWIVLSFGLALVISFPISSVVLFFVVLSLILAVTGCLVYKAYHKGLDNRDLAKNLLTDLRSIFVNILEDFQIVFTQVSDWWLRREAQLQEEMAQEHERQAQKREKLAELERKRSTKPSNDHPSMKENEYAERIQRRLQEKQTEG